MSQYNENDTNRPLDSNPDSPLTGGPTPPPHDDQPRIDPLSAEPSAEPGSTPPPPPLFSQESQATGTTATPGLDPGPAPGATPPPPPTGGPTPGYGQNNYGAPPSQPAGTLTAPNAEERNWAMFAHLSAIVVGLLASAVGATFMGFLGPLVIYLMKKDQSPFIADQAKEALNFYITVGIIFLVLILASFTIILMVITIPLMFVVGIGSLVLSIMASVKASEGQLYRYPFTLRLIN